MTTHRKSGHQHLKKRQRTKRKQTKKKNKYIIRTIPSPRMLHIFYHYGCILCAHVRRTVTVEGFVPSNIICWNVRIFFFLPLFTPSHSLSFILFVRFSFDIPALSCNPTFGHVDTRRQQPAKCLKRNHIVCRASCTFLPTTTETDEFCRNQNLLETQNNCASIEQT